MRIQIKQLFLVRTLYLWAEVGRKGFDVFLITVEIHLSSTAFESFLDRSMIVKINLEE